MLYYSNYFLHCNWINYCSWMYFFIVTTKDFLNWNKHPKHMIDWNFIKNDKLFSVKYEFLCIVHANSYFKIGHTMVQSYISCWLLITCSPHTSNLNQCHSNFTSNWIACYFSSNDVMDYISMLNLIMLICPSLFLVWLYFYLNEQTHTVIM